MHGERWYWRAGADFCVWALTDTHSGGRESVEGEGFVFVFSAMEEYLIIDNVYNWQNILIINVSPTFIGFIVVFNSVMTTCL